MGYYRRRIVQGLVTYVAATTVAFVLYRMLPGGPVRSLARQEMIDCQETTGADCNYNEILDQVESRVAVDPDQSIPQAYVDFLADVTINMNFGVSTQYQEPVFDLLFRAMPWSLFISLFGLAIGFTFNIFWGSVLAYNEGNSFDRGGTIFSMVGNSIPYYVAAILALSYFAYELALFPRGGRFPDQIALVLPVIGTVFSEPSVQPGYNLPLMLGVIWHGSLPIFTGFVLGISGLAMRGNSIRVMESEYIRVARLRGLSKTRIAQRYVARNAVLPLYTKLMIGIASIFSSGIITERIFTYPAVGWYTFNALTARDYPLLMGAFLFYTGITIVGILVADFTYQLVDPRAGGGNREAY